MRASRFQLQGLTAVLRLRTPSFGTKDVMSEHGRAMMTTPKRREEWHIFRIGSVAGIVGSLLAMVGNLLHPATPIGDPQGVARTIAESENWVLVHLVIAVGLILMLGGLVALSRSIEGGLAGVLARLGSVAAVAGVTVQHPLRRRHVHPARARGGLER